jgi:hypothetical protein
LDDFENSVIQEIYEIEAFSARFSHSHGADGFTFQIFEPEVFTGWILSPLITQPLAGTHSSSLVGLRAGLA